MTATNDKHLKELNAFQVLQDEVAHLRKERDDDQERLERAETEASEAKQRADEAMRQVDKLQLQVNTLQRELDRAQGVNAEKDKRIAELEEKIIILIRENSELRRALLVARNEIE